MRLSTSWSACVPVVPFNSPGRASAAQEVALAGALDRVLKSGWYVHGPEHEAFEREFADYLGVQNVIGVASGTDALELALKSVTAVAKNAVLTAANAGAYATTAAHRAGFTPYYADVEESTLCLSARTVEEALARSGGGVGTVVVTHLYGRMAPAREIRDVCRRHHVALVEDCAQAVGALGDGGLAGSIGDAAAFSFYPTKNLAALGDGGAVATDRDDVARRVRQLRQYGWSRKYTVELTGGANSRLDEIQAAVLRVRLPLLERQNLRRREIVARFVKAAAGGPLNVLRADGPGHVAHLCVGLTDQRDAVRALLNEGGIATDVHYPVPDHMQPAFLVPGDVPSLPVTEWAASRVLSLPCFPEMTEEDIEHVERALRALT